MNSRERRQSSQWLPYATMVAIGFVFAGVIAGTRGGYERKENSAEQDVAQQASLAQRGDEAG